MRDIGRHRSLSGIAGSRPADLEECAGRAVQRRDRDKRRHNAQEVRSHQRRKFVLGRIAHRMRAAEYARDRRATAAAK